MKIFLDADASPITKELIEFSKNRNIELIIVKNYLTNIVDSYPKIIDVDISKESADLYIANMITSNDIVITNDRALSALVLGKKAKVIDFLGNIINNKNIDGYLYTRHINKIMRDKGIYSKNKKRRKKDNSLFINALKNLLEVKMITLFVSSKCPDCPEAIEAFNKTDLNYTIVDITESMPNLKSFLKHRDFNPYFDKIKSENLVGVPTIMIGEGEEFMEYSSSNLSKLIMKNK
ncbi:MAG: DUF188 domain-containing protein [Peptoniphilaceae bacterium]